MSARLLLDESLSERLLQPLADLFPGSAHVRSLSGAGATDAKVWECAAARGFTLTTRDEDFIGLSVLNPDPPKVLWLNVGNARSATIAALLQAHAEDIERFVARDEHEFLAIGFYSAATVRNSRPAA